MHDTALQRPGQFTWEIPDVIRIHDIMFQARHGCTESEREVGATFTINLELSKDLEPAAASDKLEDTIDVAQVHEVVRKTVTEKTHNLIETVAENLARTLLETFDIRAVRIRLHKDRSPMPGPTKGYEIEIVRQLSDYK